MGFPESIKLIFIVGFVLMLSVLIMFYIRQKFTIYDKTIMEQKELLKHLVNSIEINSVIPHNSVCAPASVESAQRAYDLFGGEIKNENRIVVSDDEDECEHVSVIEDSSSEVDNSSDTESELHKEELNNLHNQFNVNTYPSDNVKLNFNQIKSSSDVKIVNIDDLKNINEASINLTCELFENTNKETDDNKENNLNILNTKELNSEENGELIINNLSSNDSLENILKKKKFVELSKSQLQDLCKEKNLSLKGNKKELIDRLTE